MNEYDHARENVGDLIRSQEALNLATRENVRIMAKLLVGNLEHCYHTDLCKLKKELANFNMHTNTWKAR